MRKITRLILHHSASPRTVQFEDIRRWHLERGFRDIGYHYVIEEDGRTIPGRPIWETGAHARGSNRDSIGICAVGDNTKSGQCWTDSQYNALVRLVRYWIGIVPTIGVVGHRDVAATECPGIDIQWIMERV